MILRERAESKPSNGSQAEMAILSLFDRKASKVEGFVTACKLYLKMRMREMTVKE